MNPVTPNFTYVYVLQSEKNDQFYTGCTGNLRNRLAEHASGESNYTRSRGPYNLIYYEACLDSNDTFTREKYLKIGMGKKYINNRLKRFLGVTG